MKCNNPSCNNQFNPKHFNQLYCSRLCRDRMYYHSKFTKICVTCGKEFKPYTGKKRNQTHIYCSNKCSPPPPPQYGWTKHYWTNKQWLTDNYQNQTISIMSLARQIKTSRDTLTNWLHHFNIPIKPKSIVQAGKNNPYYGKNHSLEIKKKMSGPRPCVCGSKNPAWRGGYEPYYGEDWIYQKQKARERDNNTCQLCAKTYRKRKLDVHHIIPYRISKSNHLDNLITLCITCHRKQVVHYKN